MKRAPAAPRLRLAIESLDFEGRGVARTPEGKVVFVEGALPGERVEAELLQRRRSFDLMRTLAVLCECSGRRAPRCPHFGVCGGCATQHADARTQMAAKQRGLEDSLQRIGKVTAETLLPIIYGEEWGYRHRARLTVRRVAKKGGVLVGFHERRSSYIADMTRCEILPQRIARLIPGLRALVETLSIRERLPQIELAAGEDADVLVFRHLEPLTPGDEARLRAFADEAGVRVWLQPRGPDSAHAFYPPDGDALDYALPEFGLRLGFGPTDFTQVNHAVNRVLVSRAMRLLDPRPGERIGDLFCGLGNFSLPMARLGASVLGLESSEGLLERARRNAAVNGLAQRTTFAAENLWALDAGRLAALGPFDKLLIDPPRQGAIEVAKALPQAWPRRIVYVSCDPATLARDAGVLVHAQGFRLAAAGVVNMFPHTAHVESIALFERG
ncbi:MAG TPA: 23S rRNA (uracil(1939)-C(5))-methyltransferase RlmD [Burkholderiales bacterium]|nr:23S rRNA (uracil(1939)-C(5))-methyltransferase RlmD [Burkholderiales bacterium]